MEHTHRPRLGARSGRRLPPACSDARNVSSRNRTPGCGGSHAFALYDEVESLPHPSALSRSLPVNSLLVRFLYYPDDNFAGLVRSSGDWLAGRISAASAKTGIEPTC